MDKIRETIETFEQFVKIEVSEAVKELEKIGTESNRKHLQRLVYVDLVNRFDALADSLLLQFAVLDGDFKRRVLNETKDKEVFLRDLYEILLAEDSKKAVQNRVEDVARGNFLNQRHSDKLRILLSSCFSWQDTDLQRPRVFTNNGHIFKVVTRLDPYQIPDTVVGYGDWLYCRRNSIVHGDGRKLAPKDIEIMKKKFSAKPTSSMRLQIASIKSAQTFYQDLCKNLVVTKLD